jgi:hypothetical protein
LQSLFDALAGFGSRAIVKAFPVAAFLLVGCASGDKTPTELESHSIRPTPICQDVATRVDTVNRDMLSLADQIQEANNQNASKAAVRFLATGLIGLALRGNSGYQKTSGSQTRLEELEESNRKLVDEAEANRCGQVRALSRGGALFLRGADQSDSSEQESPESETDSIGVPRIYLETSAQGVSPSPKRATSQASGQTAPTNKDLMKQFLSGKISQEQYNALRSGRKSP